MFPDSVILMRGCLLFRNSGNVLLQKVSGSLYLEKGVFYGNFFNLKQVQETAQRVGLFIEVYHSTLEHG